MQDWQQTKELIVRGVVFNPAHLEQLSISQLEQDEFEDVYERIIPGFCYDNAFLTAVRLDGDAVVYGAALTKFADTLLPIEHAWVRLSDGRYVDPTYQKLTEEGAPELEVKYVKLFEVPILDYVEIAESLGNPIANFVAMDFVWFRRSPLYKHYFETRQLRQSA